MREKHLKKENLRKGPASLLKISLWDISSWLLRKQNIDSKWAIPKNY